MRAVVYGKYGAPDVLRLEDVERPVPRDDEVLIRIHATTVNRTDCGFRSAEPFIARLGYSYVTTGSVFKALLRPKKKILGTELAGEVKAVGVAVSQFEVGDQVFGVNPGEFGAHAEFVCMRESAPLAQMPTGMTFEEAAAVCDGAILALGSLRRSDLRKGQGVLVYGASGSIGTAAVQLAKEFGAYITAVCNTKNVELVRSLGADAVIDYTQEDFTKNGQTYDVIFDAVDKHSFRRCRGSLSKAGSTSQLTGGSISFWPYGPRGSETRGSCGTYLLIQEEGRPVHQGAHRGGKYRAVIDRSYPLEDVVAGTRYVETEQKTGNVVLTIYGGRAG